MTSLPPPTTWAYINPSQRANPDPDNVPPRAVARDGAPPRDVTNITKRTKSVLREPRRTGGGGVASTAHAWTSAAGTARRDAGRRARATAGRGPVAAREAWEGPRTRWQWRPPPGGPRAMATSVASAPPAWCSRTGAASRSACPACGSVDRAPCGCSR